MTKNKNSIKYINKNNIIHNLYQNNHTINANSSKNYFENINKKLSKLKYEKFMNISYTNHMQLPKKFNKNDNNINNYINKNKINISFQQNNIKSKINSRKDIYDTDSKDINKKIIFHKENNKKEVPKVKIEFKPKYNYDTTKIGEEILSDSNFGDNNYLMNSLIYKESQKTISKEKINAIKPLNKYFYSNMLVNKNNYNFITLKNKINLNKIKKNILNINNKNNKLKFDTNNLQNKNKNKIINQIKSNSATKNPNRIKKKLDNLNLNSNEQNEQNVQNEQNNKNNDQLLLSNISVKDNNNNSNLNKENEYDFVIPDKYINNENYKLIKTIQTEGKQIYLYNKGKKEIIFKSGVRKEIYNDGYQLVHFPNGDIKQNFPDSKSIYFFTDSKTVQTTYKDGLNVFKFNNNQIEKHYPDGSKFIIFPNGTKRRISKNGNEETIYPNGKIQKNYININKRYSSRNEDDLNLDSVEDFDNNNESKNVFMSYLDIEQNEIDEE